MPHVFHIFYLCWPKRDFDSDLENLETNEPLSGTIRLRRTMIYHYEDMSTILLVDKNNMMLH